MNWELWTAHTDFNPCQTKCPHCSYFPILTSPPNQPQTLELLQLQAVTKLNVFLYKPLASVHLLNESVFRDAHEKQKFVGLLLFFFFISYFILLSCSLWRVSNISPEAKLLGTAPAFHGNWRNRNRQPEIEGRRRIGERTAEYIWLL